MHEAQPTQAGSAQSASPSPERLVSQAIDNHAELRKAAPSLGSTGGPAEQPLPSFATAEDIAMQHLMHFIGNAVSQSVQQALSQFTPVLQRQNDLINQLAPLASLLPSASSPMPAKNGRCFTAPDSMRDEGYDGEEDADDDYDDTPISRVKRSRGQRDNIFHVSHTFITCFSLTWHTGALSSVYEKERSSAKNSAKPPVSAPQARRHAGVARRGG